MIWVYRIVFLPLFLLALPYYGYRMLKRGGYGENFAERFGGGQWPSAKKEKFRIWVQAVSVGELLAVETLLRELQKTPSLEIVLTTTTSTGYQLARQRYAGLALAIRYFPIDFWWFSKRTWDSLQPDLVVHMESEGWPEHLHQARQRKIPVVLANARLSDRSFRRLRRFPAGARFLVRHFTHILAASPEDRDRWLELGAEQTVLTGNLKVDANLAEPMSKADREQWRKSSRLGEGPIILGSSTWPGEESMLLQIMETFRAQGISLRLLLVPRHAERRNEIRKVLEASDWTYAFRTDPSSSATSMKDLDVYVADTTGELSRWTQIADVVVVGKSFPPHHGGQTPVEAALLEKPLVVGPQMENFRAIVRSLRETGAAVQVSAPSELENALKRLVNDETLKNAMVLATQRWREMNRGATKRTLTILQNYLPNNSTRPSEE
ncbi:MAG: 3-deoxy-D-manno-octulosonic acid transferase [Opitutales bacterium]|nr:3-deoxy-D-manno-octulosonic acid transferase [Opitutales bacterium]MCH8540177.1 3-deoxy-D-manno-octulosonic acid transferase [Opitutales bacterium]